MKKLLLIALIAFGINAKAQITLEKTYLTGGNSNGQLNIIKLTTSGYKYLVTDTSNIYLYSLNHSIFKTIPIPYNGPYTYSPSSVHAIYVSEELFNTNPSDIEYMFTYFNGIGHIKIYDEIGNILFSRDTVTVGGQTYLGYGTIVYTSSGVKMILSHKYGSDSAFVYSLPGILPCNDCTNGVVSGLANPDGGGYGNQIGVSNSYPNPSINSTRIDYTFPSGVNEGEIVFYDLQGKEIKRYKVDKTFDHVLISTADIPAGTYFFQMQTSMQESEGKRIVVIK